MHARLKSPPTLFVAVSGFRVASLRTRTRAVESRRVREGKRKCAPHAIIGDPLRSRNEYNGVLLIRVTCRSIVGHPQVSSFSVNHLDYNRSNTDITSISCSQKDIAETQTRRRDVEICCLFGATNSLYLLPANNMRFFSSGEKCDH